MKSVLTRRKLMTTGIAGVAAIPGLAAAKVATPPHTRTSFIPGEVWLDTSGKPIQVRGGSVIQVGQTFYWYGENKERTTGRDRVWHWGMRMYSSRDLYNWTDLGTFIPPEPDDPASPLHPFQFADRPHILFNNKTGQFVCWIKFLADRYQTRTVLVADRITGPYRIVASGIRPLGMGAGDFDLFLSPDDGKAYMAFERVHSEMIVADLNDEYTGFTGYYSTHLPRPGPPYTREGLAYFRRGDRHYMASSGTTGYFPNPSEVAAADTFHGPWTNLGALDRGDRTETSFQFLGHDDIVPEVQPQAAVRFRDLRTKQARSAGFLPKCAIGAALALVALLIGNKRLDQETPNSIAKNSESFVRPDPV